MSTPKPTPGGEFLALVSLDDVGPLVVDRLGLKPDSQSPLSGFAADYTAGSRSLTSGGETLAATDLTRRALGVLAHPRLFFITIMRDALEGITREVACFAPDRDPNAFVSIAPAPDDTVLVQWHASPWEFLARWFNSIASGASETIPNLIPPPVTDEAMIYLLHTVDSYRRVMMQNLLEHGEEAGRPVLDPDTFVESLGTSLTAGDSRWLLPAFLALTPGVSVEGLGDHEAALVQLETLDFFRSAEDGEGHDLLAFGDAAMVMGEEFARLWSGSAGFRIAVTKDDALMPLQDGFLAATALANHLVLLTGQEENGHPLLRHLALTRDELESVMAPMLADALDQATGKDVKPVSPPPPNPSRPDPIPPPLPTEKPCTACGRPNPRDSRFCGHCGSELEADSKT